VNLSAEDATATYDYLETRVRAYPADLGASEAGLRAIIDVSADLGQLDPPVPTAGEIQDLTALTRARQLARDQR